MYPSSETVVASIAARGLHVAPYDRVVLRVAIRDRASTGAKARKAIEDSVDRLTALTTAWERAGRVRRQLAVTRVAQARSPKGGWDGYEATHDAVLRSSDVARVSAMLEELTSLSKLSAQAPQFEFQDPEPSRRAALRDAWARVRERLEFECSLLEVPREDLAIHSWQADYDDRQHAVQKVAASRAVEGETTPGMAQVTVGLTVRYRWRATAERQR